ncbi:MAG: HigA family addiction module antidote protein [Deltaproteobacteria bacterium]|nr:HigA family addiction module antidote protein [Deltaproteobacteria bacterium]
MNLLDYLNWLDANREAFPVKRATKPIPKHPGRVLREEFIDKLGMSQSDLARKLDCRFAKINEILNEKRAITPEFAIQLEALLGLPAETWVSLQAEYDLWRARQRAAG